MPTVISVFEDGQGSDLKAFSIEVNGTLADWECSLSGATHPQQGASTAHFAIRHAGGADIVYRFHEGSGTTVDSGQVELNAGDYEIEVWKTGGNRNITASGSVSYEEEAAETFPAEAEAQTVRNLAAEAIRSAQVRRKVLISTNTLAQTRRVVRALSSFTAQTARKLHKLTSMDGQTIRTVYKSISSSIQTRRNVIDQIQAVYSAQVRRVVTAKAQFSAQSLRLVRVLALFSGQARRMVHKLAQFSAQTRRTVTAVAQFGAEFIGQTRRKLTKLTAYDVQAVRNVYKIAQFQAQTLRNVVTHIVASYSAQTSRAVSKKMEVMGQNRRQVVRLVHVSAQTVRNVLFLALASVEAQTKRTVKSLTGFTSQGFRKILRITVFIGQIRRNVLGSVDELIAKVFIKGRVVNLAVKERVVRMGVVNVPRIGNSVRIYAEFPDWDGNLADPTDIKLRILTARGILLKEVTNMVKESVGKYYYDYVITASGAGARLNFEVEGVLEGTPIKGSTFILRTK